MFHVDIDSPQFRKMYASAFENCESAQNRQRTQLRATSSMVNHSIECRCQHVSVSHPVEGNSRTHFSRFRFDCVPRQFQFLPIARNFSINSYYSGRPPGPRSKTIRKVGEMEMRRHGQVRLHWIIDGKDESLSVIKDMRAP